MIVSDIDIYRFLADKKIGENAKDINILKSLPMMIRTNGLVLSLEYLDYKCKDNENGQSEKNDRYAVILSAFESKISDSVGLTFQNFDDFISQIKSMKAMDYMYLQKEIYDFSVKSSIVSAAFVHGQE